MNVKKRLFALLLVLALTAALLPASGAAAEAGAASRTLRVDGRPAPCATLVMEGQVWVRLRDVALALRDTGSRFSADWDGETGTVLLTTGGDYEPDGSEGVPDGEDGAPAVPSRHGIRVDGEARPELSAWNLGGHNYFRLEDLGAALGFQTDLDPESGAAIIRARALHRRSGLSALSYTDEVSGAMISGTVEIDPAPWRIREEILTGSDGSFYRETTAYGEDGRILTVEVRGSGFTETMTLHYDELGRETERVQDTVFDAGGERHSVLKSEYDLWGQLIRTTGEPEGDVTVFSYDDRGNQTALERTMETPMGTWVSGLYMEYDEAGNRTRAVSVLNGETTERSEYAYDDLGNLTLWERFDASGNRSYAQENVYADGEWVQMTQDYGSRQVVSVMSRDGTGALTTVSDSPEGRTVLLSQEGGPRRQEWTDGEKSSVTVWTYDEAGRLLRMETGEPEAAPRHVTAVTYDEDGRLLHCVYENGGYREEHTWEYDEAQGKLTHTKATAYPPAEALTLNAETLTLAVGETAMLMASFLPVNALREPVTWESGNEGVAAVNPVGFVTAAAPGETVITASAGSGLRAVCTVTVTGEEG